MTFAEISRRASAEWEAIYNSRNPRIYIGTATCGRSSGALKVLERIRAELKKKKDSRRDNRSGLYWLLLPGAAS